MSAPFIQSIGPATTPSVLFASGVERAAASAAANDQALAAAPAETSPVALELSQLARALEKLAQLPGMDEQAMARVLVFLKDQGESGGLLGPLKSGSASTAASVSAPALPEELKPFAEALKTLWTAPTGEGNAAASSSSAIPSGSADLQAKFTQALQNFISSAKTTLSPLLDGASSAASSNPFAAPNAGAVKTGLTQFVQSQFGQWAALFRQGAAQSSTPAQAASAPFGLQAAASPLQAIVAQLRQLKTPGKHSDPPLLRSDYIRATLNVVAALLSDPATPQAPPAPAPASPPAPQTQPSPPAGTTPQASELASAAIGSQAPQAPDSQPAAPAGVATLASRVQSLLGELDDLKPQLTPASRQVLSQVEPIMTILAHAAATETAQEKPAARSSQAAPVAKSDEKGDAQPSGRVAELARRGFTLELPARDDSRLDDAAARLSAKGVKAEVVRDAKAHTATLRVTLPGTDPKAEPVALTSADTPVAARHAHAPAAPANADVNASNGTPKDATGLHNAALAALGHEEARAHGETGAGPLAHAEANPAHHEQYTHPEAFRLNPQVRAEAATIQIVGFFQARREQAIRGESFSASPEHQAAPARLMLEHKPVEMIRPAKSHATTSRDSTSANSSVIDIAAVSVSRA